MLDTFLVLPVANERLQLVPQHCESLIRPFIVDIRNSLIDQFPGGRVLRVNLSILHRLNFLVRSDRHRQIVPPIVAVQQPVVIVFKRPGEKDDQTPFHHWGETVNDGFRL